MWRHLKTAHAEEEEVRDITKCLDTTEKNKKLTLLRYKGNFENNKRSKARGYGEIIVARRSVSFPYAAADFIPCSLCLGYVLRADLRQHRVKHCLVASDSKEDLGLKDLVHDSMVLLGEVGHRYHVFEEQVLSRMSEGPIKDQIRRDELIMRFGSMLHEKLGVRGFHNISQRLRSIALFLQQSNQESMNAFLSPENIDEAIRCGKEVGGLEQERKNQHTELPEYARPSKAMRIGGELRQLALLKKGIALERRDTKSAKDADDFLELVNLYWNPRVAHVALQTRDAKKYEKVNVLPLTADLKKFTQTALSAIESSLTEGTIDSKDKFISLTKLVLSRLLVFNKRRPTEVSRVLLSSWLQRQTYKEETISEIKDHMTPLEKQLYDKTEVVMVRGKCGNKVPVLIPTDAARGINALLEVRDTYIPVSNKFLLARPTSASNTSGHYQGGQVLKDVSAPMNLDRPDLFTATRLRKYCGTTSQMLALSDADFEVLTKHMGHDKNVHRAYYRLPDTTLELTKAAVLMTCLDSGNVSAYAGKDLGTILELDMTEAEDQGDNCAAQPGPSEARFQHQTEGTKRKHQRFSKKQTMLLAGLLRARNEVPRRQELREWLARQGSDFVDRDIANVRSKLHNMMRSGKKF